MEDKCKDILNNKDRNAKKTAESAAQKQIVFLIYIYFVFISLVVVTKITLWFFVTTTKAAKFNKLN